MSSNVEEENKSIRENRNAYMRKYMKDRKKGTFNMVIKPSSHNMLRICYKEYVETCQANHYIPIKFNEFIVSFAEIGFYEWKNKHRKHA